MAGAMQAPVSTDVMQKTVDGYLAAIASLDVDGFVNSFSDDAVGHDPVGAPPYEGKDALRAFFLGIGSQFETVKLTPVSTFVTAGGIAVKWDGTGRSKAGKDVAFEGIDVFEFDADGKIRRLYAYWDPGALMAQLA